MEKSSNITIEANYGKSKNKFDKQTTKGGKITFTKKFSKGGQNKIKKVIKGLKKASKLHAAQAKTLKTIKVRGGGMAMQGINFKGVF